MDDSSQGPNRGPAWLITGWVTLGSAFLCFVLRIYSRTFLTRSLGSDDLMIAVSVVRPLIALYAQASAHSCVSGPYNCRRNHQLL